ncbi:MAG: MFS transporter [Planctomycetales bacterium]|nr:MFS transporter [Planctomycetales bacterium]
MAQPLDAELVGMGQGNRSGMIEPARLRQDLRASIVEGAAYGGMVGCGETYLPAFALAMGLGEMTAGMVSSVPLLAGGLMQMASPAAVRLLKSHRRWVVLCAAIQALSFLPLLWAACWGTISATGLLAVASLYWASGLATGPAWNTWIGTIVPRLVRPRFFAHRTRISQAGVFSGFLGGGVLLQYASQHDRSLAAFAALFAMATCFRLISAGMLATQSEPIPLPANMRQIPWNRIRHHLQASSGGKLLVYLVVVQAAVQMAGPFFTPFMLKKLELSYAELVFLFAVAYLAKVLSLPLWGRVAKRIGARSLLWIGGVGIAPLSGCWIVSQSVPWLTVIQIVGGITWAAYELAFFLLFFESIAEEERTSVLTLYNLLNTTAWVMGSLLGGAILLMHAASFEGYLLVFGVSSLARFAALALLMRVPQLVVEADVIGVRTVAVRPGAASLDAPVLPSLPDQLVDHE